MNKMKIATVILLILLTLACDSSISNSPREQMNGTWVSDIMTVTIDTDAGTYTGVAMGQPFDHTLTIINEVSNLVTFKLSSGGVIICQVHTGGNRITLAKQLDNGKSDVPVILNRED